MKKKRGFTLIELLLYVTISSIILLITSLFLSTLLESRIKNRTIAEVEQQGIQVMQIITQAVRNANTINFPMPSFNSDSLMITDGLNSSITFDLDPNENIKMIYENGIPLTNSRVTVSDLLFTNLSGISPPPPAVSIPGTVKIEFTLTSVNTSGKNEYDFEKTFTGSATLRQQILPPQ